ncbi:MAG: 30S ribosomal protein S6 [Thermodesulfovibrionia bacterium]|nr:MAG: 30S ribosomal protein S6 [Thermodesulfovibrionia bacterium]
MNYYENIIILDPNLDEKTVESAVERVRDLVIKKGGEVLKSENWGLKKLSYNLKKQKKGLYILLFFKAPSPVIAELEKFYKVFEPLLKFLIVKLKKKHFESVLSAISEAKSGQDAESAPLEKRE